MNVLHNHSKRSHFNISYTHTHTHTQTQVDRSRARDALLHQSDGVRNVPFKQLCDSVQDKKGTVVVLVGSGGSGKSSVLARFVTVTRDKASEEADKVSAMRLMDSLEIVIMLMRLMDSFDL